MEFEDPEETIAKLSDWFTSVCKFQPPLAKQLASELVNNCGITGYEQFPILQQADPNWLNNLECPIPTLAKILVKVNVEKIGRTPLRSLDLEDVRGILEACYAEFPYGQIFKEKQISGFNLSYVEKVEELKAFGITNDIHAMTLFASVTEWKRVGVPNELIASNTLRNVHIKEEAYREVTRARNASPSVLLGSSSSAEAQQNLQEGPGPVQNVAQHNSEAGSNGSQDEMEISSGVAEGAQDNPVIIISSTSSSCSSSSSSAKADAEAGQMEHTNGNQAASTQSSSFNIEEGAMEEAPETPQASFILPVNIPSTNEAGLDDKESEGEVATQAQHTTHLAHTSFTTSPPLNSTESVAQHTSSPPSTTSTGSAVTAATSATAAQSLLTTNLEQAPAEPKARVQQRSISEAKQLPAKPQFPKSGTGKGRQKQTARRPKQVVVVNTAETYHQYYQGAAFPGMPQHALLQTQYASIAEKMGRTQVNTAVALTEHEAEMLRSLPEQMIGGKWIVKNTDDSESSYGCMQSYETIQHSEQRENSLVFVPSAQLATELAVAHVKPPSNAKITPSAEYMIVIIVSSPEERKKHAMEGTRLFHPELTRSGRSEDISVSRGDDVVDVVRPTSAASAVAGASIVAAQKGQSSSTNSRSLIHSQQAAASRSDPDRDFDGLNDEGAVPSSPSSSSDSEASSVAPTTTRSSSRKRARSPSSQGPDNEYSLRQRPKRSSAGVKGAILDLEAQALRPRRATRSVASTDSVNGSTSGSARRHSSANEISTRRHIVSPASNSSNTSRAPTSSTARAAGRHSLGASSSSAGSSASAGKKSGEAKTVTRACHDILHSRDNQDLINGVNFLGTATSKNGREAVDYIVKSGTYQRLLHFIHLAPQLPSIFVYYVLRTVSLIVTRLDGLAEIELIFENNRFKDIVQLCNADHDFVREQSLHLVSEIGVGEEHGLKQRVLNAGAVQAIIESYNNTACFSNPKTVARIQGQCARSLYKLASMSTPKQFPLFVPALPVLHDVLLNPACSWVAVVEAAQAVSFLVMPDQPRQIELLMEHNLFDVLVSVFQDNTRNSALRWHASIFVWSVAKHCSNAQMRKLFRLMGILGNVCHTDNAHPHLRAAALNILQVMLQRGDFIVQQFVHHRDKIPTIVLDLLRGHKHKKLVHGDSRSSNCIVKYASFTLAHAVLGANKEQLLKLLDLGAYPLLFKIISFEGETERPEEVKFLGVNALSHLLQEVPSEVRTTHQREMYKRANPTAVADAWWAVVRGLVEDGVEDEEDLSFVNEAAQGSVLEGNAAAARKKEFLWSEELREKAQDLIDMAHEVGLL